MSELTEFGELLAAEHGLAVVGTARADGSVLSSVVNAGVLPHPTRGDHVVGFVSGPTAHRLGHLRAGRPVTLTVRRGWSWMSVTGGVDLIGPDDPYPGAEGERLRWLLREVFTAAGGTHDDWDAYDRAMSEERRVVVLVRPRRFAGNR